MRHNPCSNSLDVPKPIWKVLHEKTSVKGFLAGFLRRHIFVIKRSGSATI